MIDPGRVRRAGLVVLLVLALVLTIPVVFVGAVAGFLVAASERWVALVGRLGDRVGWLSRRRR